MNTVLITGASSGYGLETARHFHDKGWRVIATMRKPRPDLLPSSERLALLPLEVTDADSIATCIAAAGPIDVLVNNAGIGMAGIFEATPMAEIRRLFDTNTFGAMAMIQAVLPGFRAQGSGCVVNVTSSAVLAPFPMVAAYTASKSAIEGFTGVLALELGAIGIGVKLVEPGYGPDTNFTRNSGTGAAGAVPAEYDGFIRPIVAGYGQRPALFTTAAEVAATVWEAAHDRSGRLQFPAGPDAVALLQARG